MTVTLGPCPHCRKPPATNPAEISTEDGSVALDPVTGQVGALVICQHCIRPSYVERVTRLNRMMLRTPTVAEAASLQANPGYHEVRAFMLAKSREQGAPLVALPPRGPRH